MLKRLWREDEGVLTFEWILLLTLLVIGVIGGVAGIRDAILHEAQGVVGAIVALDQSYAVTPPLGVGVSPLNASNSGAACDSSAVYFKFQDNATWVNGRFSSGQLSGIAQTTNASGSLCGLP
jgi:hypothetical protein